MRLPIPRSINRRSPIKAKLMISAALVLSGACLFCVILFRALTGAPVDFPPQSTFSVASGSSVRDIAEQAAEEGFVRSGFILYLVLATSYQPSDLFAGDFVFTEPVNTFTFANTIAGKQVEQYLVRLTFPEGTRAETMADIAADELAHFDITTYLTRGIPLEGRLFPETYLVPETFTADELIDLQISTFNEKIAPFTTLITTTPFSLDEVLTLASIIEREANDEISMRTVAGIYLNRLEIGMPLQADASIEYVLEKPLEELTPDDLKTDSPYNTYTNTGLPPTPIGNPGLVAIKAVLNPQVSDYYYYITGPDGTFYYARTLDEHNRNIERYLR